MDQENASPSRTICGLVFWKTDCFLVSDLNFNIMHASCAFFFEKGGDVKFRAKRYVLYFDLLRSGNLLYLQLNPQTICFSKLAHVLTKHAPNERMKIPWFNFSCRISNHIRNNQSEVIFYIHTVGMHGVHKSMCPNTKNTIKDMIQRHTMHHNVHNLCEYRLHTFSWTQ